MVVAGFTVLAGEGAGRFALGLGDPPLTVRDPEIDYLFAPGTGQRFGHTIRYNRYHMRADEPPSPDVDGPRVLVMGDSVVNGGALTDHGELATTLLQERLRETQSDAWVGHVSAGSWGPANLLAYVERFGWFDADVAILVLSTHDLEDLPAFRDRLGADFPTEPPALALEELVRRYLPRYVPALNEWLGAQPSPPTVRYDDPRDAGARALRALLDAAQARVATVVAVLHPTRAELAGAAGVAEEERRRALAAVLADAGVATLDPVEHWAARDDLHRDFIHVNAAGQRAYATLFACIAEAAGRAAPPEDCGAVAGASDL